MKKSIEDLKDLPQEREFQVEFGPYQIIGRFQAGTYEGNEALIQVARSYAAALFCCAFIEKFKATSTIMMKLVSEASTAIRKAAPGVSIKEGEFDHHKKNFRMRLLLPQGPPSLKLRVYGLRGRAKTIYINTSI